MLRPVIENMITVSMVPAQFDPFGGGNTAERAGFGSGGYAGAAATAGGYGAASSGSASAVGINGSVSTVARGTEIFQAGALVPAELEEMPFVSAQIQGYDGMIARIKGLLEKEENAGIVLAGTYNQQACINLVAEIGELLDSTKETRAHVNLPFKSVHYSLLYSIAANIPAGQSAALFLLRLMTPYKEEDLPRSLATDVIVPLLGMVTQACSALSSPSSSSSSFPSPFKNISALVFALITLSNWCSEDRSAVYAAGEVSEEALLDASMSFLHCERIEVRQIASALAYNLVLYHPRRESIQLVAMSG